MQIRPVPLGCPLAGLLFVAATPQLAHGACEDATVTLTVDTTEESVPGDAQCSLREAIEAVNMGATVDACTIAESGVFRIELPAGTYSLGPELVGEDLNVEGDLDVRADLCIEGAGQAQTIIDGQLGTPLIHADNGVDLDVRHLGLHNCADPQDQGVGALHIDSGGSLYAEALDIEGCDTTAEPFSSDATTTTLRQVRIDGNTTPGPLMATDSTTTTLEQVALSNNTVSDDYVMYVRDNTLVARDLRIVDNEAYDRVIYLWNDGSASPQNDFDGLLIAGNDGDELENLIHSRSASVQITNATLTNNTILEGAIEARGDAGIYHLSHVSIVGNQQASSVFSFQGGDVFIQNSILSGNTLSDDECDFVQSGSSIVSLGNNVLASSCGQAIESDIVTDDPDLAVLAPGGGFTMTLAPQPTSPALGLSTCSDVDGNPLTVDQRGVERPAEMCTAGAYQLSCGDGHRAADETCDGDDLGDADCTDYGYATPEGLSCSATCDELVVDGCAADCGNGMTEPGEECDHGTDNSDTEPGGCSESCTMNSDSDTEGETSGGETSGGEADTDDRETDDGSETDADDGGETSGSPGTGSGSSGTGNDDAGASGASGGCSTTRGSNGLAGLLFLALVALRRRRST